MTDIPTAMDEARMVIFGAVDELLERTGINRQDIDILITSNSIFCPTPRSATREWQLKGPRRRQHTRWLRAPYPAAPAGTPPTHKHSCLRTPHACQGLQ